MKQPIVLRIYRIIYFIIMVTIVLFCVFHENYTSSVDLNEPSVYTNFSEGWTDNSGNVVELNDLWTKSSKKVIIYHPIPSGIKRGQRLRFASRNVNFSVFMGGNLVYSFFPEENLTGKGYGNQFHEVDVFGYETGDTIRMEIYSIYPGEESGTLGYMCISTGEAFIYRLLKERGVAALLSLLIVFFGITLIVLQFSSFIRNNVKVDMYSLGVTAILLGLWTLQETMIPNLLIGGSGLFRALDYVSLMLVNYPTIVFVNSISKRRVRLFESIAFFNSVITIALMLFLRYVFEVDFHRSIWILHISLIIAAVEVVAIMYTNRVYCKENGIKAEMNYFYLGAAFFAVGGVIDMLVYNLGGKGAFDSGIFLRIGLFFFIITMIVQIAKWMSNEQKVTDQDRFINGLLKYSMAGSSPERNVRSMVEYMGRELHADRAFILEEQERGQFANTYEWCRDGIHPKIGEQQSIPFKGVLDIWFKEFNAGRVIRIENMATYRPEAPELAKQYSDYGIKTVIADQLNIDETHIGCFGVENIPKESMDDIQEIIKLISFFLSVTLRQRNTQTLLRKYSYRDQMTGVMNRRALEEFEEEKLDKNKPYGVLMVDINGLKRMNDHQGHDMGDQLIRDVANALGEVFTKENVYRLGGDEFLAIGFSSTEAVFKQNIKTVELLLAAKKRSASMGYVFMAEGGGDFEEVKKQADTLMYKDKQRFYEMGANNRRESR